MFEIAGVQIQGFCATYTICIRSARRHERVK